MIYRVLSLLAVGGLILTSACSGGGGTTSNSALPSTAAQSGSPVTTQSNNVPSLKCFSTDTGTCKIDKTTGEATLTIPSPAPNDAGAGIYFANSNNLKGLTISQIADISITFAQGSTPYHSGTPRFVISWSGASDGSSVGVIYPVSCADVIAGTGALASTTADINDSSTTCMQTNASNTVYTSWASFVAAFGNAVITQAPYFVADASYTATIQTYYITNMAATAK